MFGMDQGQEGALLLERNYMVIRRAIGWISTAILIVGQALPWTRSARPATQAWDYVFSHVSKPNPEWWIWLLAPVAAIILSCRGLMKDGSAPRTVFVPILVFFASWAGLYLSGSVRYLGFNRPGFMATVIGLALLAVAAFLPGKKAD